LDAYKSVLRITATSAVIFLQRSTGVEVSQKYQEADSATGFKIFASSELGMVAQACNPTYLGSEDWED
jgi:hypothetical protein